MGAKCIFDISIESTFPATAEREIIRRVEAHTGRKVGTWEVSVSVYGTADKKRPTLEVVSLSDVDARLFALIHLGATVIETDRSFVPMVKRISSYQHRLTKTIRGAEYDFVDFCVRVGLAFDRHNAAKGVIVEIEYRPCPVAADCERLIEELMGKIAAPLVPPPQSSQDRSVSDAAMAAYSYKRVELDTKTLNVKDLNPFSHRTGALLYAKLLRS